jgi:transcriptional regulator with XRE-family HTH domain
VIERPLPVSVFKALRERPILKVPRRGRTYALGMPPTTALGLFLRARREMVRPEDVNLRTSGRRRVSGLRREELAMLAGISPDYYLRLEQGRDRHPSSEVLDALARALRLDADSAAYLHTLSQLHRLRSDSEETQQAPASLVQLIASWTNAAAVVHGRYIDVLAANALSTALLPVFTPGINLVRAVFLDPDVRRSLGDWEASALRIVARLRALMGPNIEDPRLADLVSDLSARSASFRRLWALHDIKLAARSFTTFNHPTVGSLDLRAETLAIIGTAGQHLVIFHADPGTASERALNRLARTAAGQPD